MADETVPLQMVEYEGFEIHVALVRKTPPNEAKPSDATDNRYTYTGYVCHPGADPTIRGHAVQFHADGEESFNGEDEALYEAVHVGRSIIDGTHPDLTVLPLVTGGV